jgi:hypothetical protein
VTYVPQETLYAIMARDPDGGSVEPTQGMYKRFRLWVILAYGLEVWKVYAAGGWAQDRTVGDWSAHYEDHGN